MIEAIEAPPAGTEATLFEVRQSREVAATVDEAWLWLTAGERLGRWFADSGDLVVGEPFCFAFGDGDYFSGRVLETEAPSRLRLEWRFMGLGRSFEIDFRLEAGAEGGRTRVAVCDRGAISQAEAEGLEWGWGDFFDRLERAVQTGENARYRWSEEIALGAFARRDPRPLLSDRSWWQAAFPGAEVECLAAAGDPASTERWRGVYRFRDPAWGEVSTEATVTYRTHGEVEAISAGQKGFDSLPEAVQVGERRRYAELWERALGPFEEGT